MEPVWEHKIEEWMKQEYIGKEFGEDVTFLLPKTGQEIYWEHDGRNVDL